MKWNRKGIIFCGILFVCIVAAMGINTFRQSELINKEVHYASEEDIVIPQVKPVTQSAVRSNNSLVVSEKETVQKEKKSENEKKSVKKTVKERHTDTKKIDKKSVAKKEEKKKTASPTKIPTPTVASPTPKHQKEVQLSIQCLAIMNHKELWKEGIESIVPNTGYFYKGSPDFRSGESVYDIINRVCAEQKIALDAEYTVLYKTYYIKGIGNLYEFDCGAESGWKYKVNGVIPGVGCSSYIVQEGDSIEIFYDYQY